ncbi:tRNA (adenosine(37)-N6)-threonylcarbamoyltransferase complex ATPase subunit type 1 TsaE [Candidatus Berkelbacteria bacterium CG06_land_8_20_14_3_00_43_10]|nr:MAG: tRNA (adenosine(37)-N6)-threonylcarbamoyltransferase complex ATPase subunit type 1 TsaE [Candidatus Berkelbacteria bacterium CG2_30_43_20]PIU87045.1 MAG: tRNA (adenosine(37)-N6)-threonylcarbamoyltransferase complex ATPase subunit type 1 TsaE [Candidatus Berkelbacteria bacterium CG06_land_8_20_14_3_00_43_10]
MAHYTIASKKGLKDYARQYASRLKPGDVVGFVGELGAGKTTLVQYIGEYCGVKQLMRSPTFMYIKEYYMRNGSSFVHCDAYRLTNSADVRSIGLDDYIGSKRSIVCIEWADKIRDVLPCATQWVTLTRIGGLKRKIEDDRKEHSG